MQCDSKKPKGMSVVGIYLTTILGTNNCAEGAAQCSPNSDLYVLTKTTILQYLNIKLLIDPSKDYHILDLVNGHFLLFQLSYHPFHFRWQQHQQSFSSFLVPENRKHSEEHTKISYAAREMSKGETQQLWCGRAPVKWNHRI